MPKPKTRRQTKTQQHQSPTEGTPSAAALLDEIKAEQWALPGRPLPKHVAIVAMGKSCAEYVQTACGLGSGRNLADEIWAINATAAILQHDRAFVMDDVQLTLPREAAEGKKVAQEILQNWLPKHPGPVYTSTVYPEYPALVEFPLAAVVQAIGGFPYLNTSVAHAIGFAMMIGVKDLSLYGCDFTYPDIHASEAGRGCVEFLLGRASAQGIGIRVPPTTTLFDSNVPHDFAIYGYPRGVRVTVKDGLSQVTHGPFPTSTSTAGTEAPKAT